MAGGTTVRSDQHPYMKDYFVEKFGLFTYINRNPGPSKSLMSEKQWEAFCRKKADSEYISKTA